MLLCSFSCMAQKKLDVSIASIPEDLKKDVHKIVVDRSEIVEIVNQNILRNKSSETNLVFDEIGLKGVDLSLYYDKLKKIKAIECKVYDANGILVKTFREKDFTDTSIADGFSVFTDDRLKHIQVNHYQYPFF